MNYEDFFKEVQKSIAGYLPEKYRNSDISVLENTKNNMKLHGIAIQPEGMEAVPFIYLEPYCDRYNKGEDVGDLLQEIADTYVEHAEHSNEMKLPELDYDSIGEHLRVRLINTKANTELLREAVSRPVSCGFSLVAYLDLEKMTGYSGFIQINKDMTDTIGCDEKTLFTRAMENSVEKVPAVLCTMEDIVYKYAPGWKTKNLLEANDKEDSGEGMYVLSNMEGEHGAAALFYPGVQEKISEVVGGDYYVLPSSIHEVLIIKDDIGIKPKELAQMVKGINEIQVGPLDKLADKVMHYRVDLKLLEVAVDLEKNREPGKER